MERLIALLRSFAPVCQPSLVPTSTAFEIARPDGTGDSAFRYQRVTMGPTGGHRLSYLSAARARALTALPVRSPLPPARFTVKLT